MSRKNYVKYSQMNKENNDEVVLDKTSIDTPEIIEEAIDTQNEINEAIDTQNEINEAIDTQNEINEDEVQIQNNEEIEQPNPIPAVVINCAKLRVRKAPDANADVYGTIEKGTELTVDNGEENHGDFYKVYTVINETLITGYCMKKFIELK